ncbi:MAG: UDP-N-acetylglucosamine 1-carboxyvinyltransferase, partial [Candidatus Acidiferrales bacterium]
MDRFKIEGGRRLEGEVRISGAKNSALPAMAAALLTAEPVRLTNIPHVRDIITMAKLLAHMRCQVETPDIPPSEFTIRAQTVSHAEAPYELVKTMRASVLTLGPLVARFGYARVSLPGGCAIGARPIDLHIQALEKLGAEISVEHGYVEARAKRLRGALFRFPKITVTGTENVLTAAVLAEGETILENAALEPEVGDLAALLVKMGAKIEGAGTHTIRVEGVERLHGATHAVIPDRIEAGTFLVAGAITGGELLLTNCEPEHLGALMNKLVECGVEIRCEGEGALRVRAAKKLTAADVTTEEYPG